MDRATDRLVRSLNPGELDTAEISGKKWRNFGFRSYRSFRYPEHDICSGIDEGPFDLIIAEQVWEHLPRPYKATRNVLRMLTAGGYFLVTVPFLIRYHGNPIDCTRWTKEGLENFLAECGFPQDEVVAEDWGNRECVVANLSEWAEFDEREHSLAHEQEFPMVAWALAKKGADTGLLQSLLARNVARIRHLLGEVRKR